MDLSSSSSKTISAGSSYNTFNLDHGNTESNGAESGCPGASDDHESLKWRSQDERSYSKYSRFIGYDQPKEALDTMREVLDKLCENKVRGPQLFRLDSEFCLEFGEGTQFKVTGPSIKHMKALTQARKATSDPALSATLDNLSSIVVKRALWVPDNSMRRAKAERRIQKLSRAELTKELHGQMQSCKKEIDRLCNKSYIRHPNIVLLRGWGLCLDTFENMSPLNTRIPLLVLEKATCDLGDFLASSNYNQTPFETLTKICQDIGTGLGGLHRGNVTHGDLKPENVLLFAEYSPDSQKTLWTAKLCDFGSGEASSREFGLKDGEHMGTLGPNPQVEVFEQFRYDGTPNWIPPEAMLDRHLALEDLKRCDVFVYGLIVWRIFSSETIRGAFDTRTLRRRGGKGPVKDDESKINDYLTKDRAYQNAATDIKDAYRLAKLNVGDGAPVVSQIPSAQERDRLLVVLRAALHAIPRFRDQRPWKYFDRAYYQSIRSINENPARAGWDQNDDFLNNPTLRVADPIPRFGFATELFKSVQKRAAISVAQVSNLLPNIRWKSPRQKAFESLFISTSEHVPLGLDFDELAVVEHGDGVPCYDISLFCSGFFGSEYLDSDIVFYSYARLRSRLKLCCWEQATFRDGNVLFKRLCGPASFSYTDTIIAWLARGEIGREELRLIQDSQRNRTMLNPFVNRNTMHFLAEHGFFVGLEVDTPLLLFQGFRQHTMFSHFLRKGSTNEQKWSSDDVNTVEVCAKIRATSNLTLLPVGGEASGESSISHWRRRFFYTGEAPDLLENGIQASYENMRSIKLTTLLHEAVFSCSYIAVEYFVSRSVIPLTVQDCNDETALELALRMKENEPEQFLLPQLNLIIGLLTQNSKQKDPESDLPLGWNKIQFEPGIIGFQEATVNPGDPSFTFVRPKFSLLQKTQISLGTRASDQGHLTYNFGLVRFMHQSKIEESTPVELRFGDEWFRTDISRLKISHVSYSEAISSFLKDFIIRNNLFPRIDPESRWIRGPATFFHVTRTVLYRSYANILLFLVPLSCVALAKGWTTSAPVASLLLAVGSSIILMDMIHISLDEIRMLYNQPMEGFFGRARFWRQSSSMRWGFSSVENCLAELLIGISALSHGEVSVVQNIVIGSIMCNLLVMPGTCFFAGGIHNSRTGTAEGIEQIFSSSAAGTTSQLSILGASISLLLFAFQATGSGSFEGLEHGVVFLSRAIATIMLVIFLLWLLFRYKSHYELFEMDDQDGYDDNHHDQPKFGLLSNILIIIICTAPLYVQAESVVLSLQALPLTTSNILTIFLIPLLLPAGKHIRSVNFAVKDQMDPVLDLTLGFTVSVCFFLLPFLVILSWILGHALTLRLDIFGTAAYALSAWVVAYVVVDGKSNWIEGMELLGV